jgi:hypothetical protein
VNVVALLNLVPSFQFTLSLTILALLQMNKELSAINKVGKTAGVEDHK